MTEGTPYRVAPPSGLQKCPHCGRLTAPSAHSAVRWVCGGCGGPVIPSVDATKLDRDTLASLRNAAILLSPKRMAMRTLVRGAIALPVLTVLFGGAPGKALLGFLVLLVVASFLALDFGAQRKNRLGSAEHAVNEAWLRAVALLVRERGGFLGAQDLATTTRISLGDAETILRHLTMENGRIDIDADQQLQYRIDAQESGSSEPAASPKLTRSR
jgi:hypothetical protein